MLTAVLDDNKAEDIQIISLEGKSAIADFMIVASGRSARHVVALAELLGDALVKNGHRHPRYEGRENGDWVLVDTGDAIVHLFRPEVRSFYNLEKIWNPPEEVLPTAKPRVIRKRKVAS